VKLTKLEALYFFLISISCEWSSEVPNFPFELTFGIYLYAIKIMDIKQYQQDRDKDLSGFQTQYDSLKTEYNKSLTDLIENPDKINTTLDANKSLSKHVREFISANQAKLDKTTLDSLTEDIIKYQKEYQQIKRSNANADVLKSIIEKNNVKVAIVRTKFNIFLGFMLLIIAAIVFLIFRVRTTLLPQLPSLPQSTMSGVA